MKGPSILLQTNGGKGRKKETKYRLWLGCPEPQWRYSGFQVRGMIEWGQKSKPKKSLDQELTPQKCQAKLFVLFLQNYNLARIRKYYLVLNTPKNPYFKSNHQKINTCQIFLPKKILESKISNPQKSFYYQGFH